MSYLIDINTEELRNAVNVAQRVNMHLTDAMQCLNQVVIHDDWGCPERDSINRNTIENRKTAETLQYNSEMFYKNILYAADRFVQVENEIEEMLGLVDGPLAQFLSLVPQPDVVANWGATNPRNPQHTSAGKKALDEALKNIDKSTLTTMGGFNKSVDIVDFEGIFSSLTKK